MDYAMRMVNYFNKRSMKKEDLVIVVNDNNGL
jgi:hypothetical protein